MKLLGSTENKITKDKKGENVLHLEITEAVLTHLIFSIIIISKIQESCTGFFEINRLVVYKKFLQQIIFFKKHFNSEFQDIEVWFTDQNSQPLEIEERINKKEKFSA